MISNLVIRIRNLIINKTISNLVISSMINNLVISNMISNLVIGNMNNNLVINNIINKRINDLVINKRISSNTVAIDTTINNRRGASNNVKNSICSEMAVATKPWRRRKCHCREGPRTRVVERVLL